MTVCHGAMYIQISYPHDTSDREIIAGERNSPIHKKRFVGALSERPSYVLIRFRFMILL